MAASLWPPPVLRMSAAPGLLHWPALDSSVCIAAEHCSIALVSEFLPRSCSVMCRWLFASSESCLSDTAAQVCLPGVSAIACKPARAGSQQASKFRHDCSILDYRPVMDRSVMDKHGVKYLLCVAACCKAVANKVWQHEDSEFTISQQGQVALTQTAASSQHTADINSAGMQLLRQECTGARASTIHQFPTVITVALSVPCLVCDSTLHSCVPGAFIAQSIRRWV
jgi:hypothetical protein